ncbi:hypothetical protein Cni_G24289 [Canna indica]|uniref:AB hydrolase-1 domain-containing protein n=1 Tax=Canna indica TaxID=4628 RepID=A0AAQ3QN16_9LILI|nr:hypothetical protein Cni_G24289 [Canna indica]
MGMANTNKISAANARSHTRKNHMHSSSFSSPFHQGMVKNIGVMMLIGVIALVYKAIQPTPPIICGSPGGPPVSSPRIKLKDGRHLAYKEYGVPKEIAKHKIIFIHGFDSCKHDVIPISPAIFEELGIHLVSFDRAGYGESDPNPKRTEKSTAEDVEQLADQLQLGDKFYVIGFSMGGQITWTCLRYIPHRLAGAAILAPVANFWWHGFPPNVSDTAFNIQLTQDRWAVRVAHYAPWLTYWWNTQKWFPSSGVASNNLLVLSPHDWNVIKQISTKPHLHSHRKQVRQQGELESLHRDMMVGFGRWEFSPMDLENPFPNGEGSIHLWHGADDRMVPITFSRYIAENLPWIQYHEVSEGGHLFPLADGMGDAIVRSLFSRE